MTGSKLECLANQEILPEPYSESFLVVRNSVLRVSRVWTIEELFRNIWTNQIASWEKRNFEK
jgi:hypothetical protein